MLGERYSNSVLHVCYIVITTLDYIVSNTLDYIVSRYVRMYSVFC